MKGLPFTGYPTPRYLKFPGPSTGGQLLSAFPCLRGANQGRKTEISLLLTRIAEKKNLVTGGKQELSLFQVLPSQSLSGLYLRNVGKIEEISREVGFDLVGVAPAAPPPDLSRFDDWLGKGYEGEMAYLKRNRDRIAAPQELVPGAKSILCLGLGYSRGPGEMPGGGKIARYALGHDYHNFIGKLLNRLKEALLRVGLARSTRSVVDAGPLLERSHAAAAGLGFLSKSGNLLNKKFGPWFFLGELITDIEIEPTPPKQLETCGACRACIDACPTGAILEPFVVDSRKCISYLTIEHRSAIPRELRPKIGDWFFGCDICIEVCPFGRKAPDHSARFGRHPATEKFRLVDLLDMPEPEYKKSFLGSAMKRAKWQGLIRNALVVLGNRKDPETVPAIRKKMTDPDPLIREHAAWALGRL